MEERVKDKYDEAIERLTNNPELIEKEWSDGKDLFQFAGTGGTFKGNECINAGCLTQIRNSTTRVVMIEGGPNYKITDEIRSDSRIPRQPSKITVDSLPVFAEWQRKLDMIIPERQTAS